MGDKKGSDGGQGYLHQEDRWCHGKRKSRTNNDDDNGDELALGQVQYDNPSLQMSQVGHHQGAGNNTAELEADIECDSGGSGPASSGGNHASGEDEVSSRDGDIEVDGTFDELPLRAQARTTPRHQTPRTANVDRTKMSNDFILMTIGPKTRHPGNVEAFPRCRYQSDPACKALTTENMQGFCPKHFCDLYRTGLIDVPERIPREYEHRNEVAPQFYGEQRNYTSSDSSDGAREKEKHRPGSSRGKEARRAQTQYDERQAADTAAYDSLTHSIQHIHVSGSSGNDSPRARGATASQRPLKTRADTQTRCDIELSGEEENVVRQHGGDGSRRKKAPTCSGPACFNQAQRAKGICNDCFRSLYEAKQEKATATERVDRRTRAPQQTPLERSSQPLQPGARPRKQQPHEQHRSSTSQRQQSDSSYKFGNYLDPERNQRDRRCDDYTEPPRVRKSQHLHESSPRRHESDLRRHESEQRHESSPRRHESEPRRRDQQS